MEFFLQGIGKNIVCTYNTNELYRTSDINHFFYTTNLSTNPIHPNIDGWGCPTGIPG
jgi:hypothetical protein